MDRAPYVLIQSCSWIWLCNTNKDMCVEAFKEELARAIDKRLQVFSNVMLFKAVSYTMKKQRIKLF